MPVNMDPNKRLRKKGQEQDKTKEERDEMAKAEKTEAAAQGTTPAEKNLDEVTETDLAEKEWQHLWDATEVIDMDKW